MKVNMRIGTRILAGYGVALLVVGGVGIVAYRSVTELVDSADRVSPTQKVKEALFEVRSALKDAETGQRGFIIPGAERYLEPYPAALKVVDRYMQDARDLIADDRNQQKRFAAIEPLVAQRLAVLAEVIVLGRERGVGAAAQSMLTDKGKNLLEAIRRVSGEMIDDENRRLTH